MNIEKFTSKLQSEVAFPHHGWIRNDEGHIYLIFPIFPTIWKQYGKSSPLFSSKYGLPRVDHFSTLLFNKIIHVLSKIAEAEKLIITERSEANNTVEEWAASFHEANTFLSIWTDSFYNYFRILADRLTLAIGSLIMEPTSTFPQNYKNLLKASSDGSFSNNWKITIDQNTLARCIKENSEWYEKLVEIRTWIHHRRGDSTPIFELNTEGKVHRVQVRFNSVARDVSEKDILLEIPRIISGFCNCLSLLPLELWSRQNYNPSDVVRHEGDWPAVTRFFPKLS